jgi:glycosyltransferase involved in cell wall biosynthesis
MVGVSLLESGRARLPRNIPEGAAFAVDVPRAIWRLRRLVREARPDVTWVNSLFNPWALLGARLAGTPAVWHLHERNPPFPAGILAPGLAGMTGVTVVAISSFVAESLAPYPWLKDRIKELPNPLAEDLTPPSREPEGPFTVGYVGQLEPRKRAPDLARALIHLEDVQAVFIGDGKARGSLEGVVQECGVSGRVQLLGFREDPSTEFPRFHCVAIPSLREPFGLVALEAMASGLPVVAARSGALPEVLGNAALFHEPGDFRDLARQIEALRESTELRRELRSRGLQRVRRFQRDGWLDSVEAILEEARKGGRRP